MFPRVSPTILDAQKRAPSTAIDFRNARLISFESNQILHHAAKISAHAQIADEDKLVIHFKTRGRCLLSGARIDLADIHLQPIKSRIALCRLALLEGLLVKLLNQEHGGASGQDTIVPDQFSSRHAGREKR